MATFYLCETFFILLFGNLLVEPVVIFMPEVNAPKTVHAIDAVEEKPRIDAITYISAIHNT